MKNKRQVKLVKRIKTIRQKYLILLGSAIVTILIVSTVNIVQWYQTEQYAQATRKDRERFEAVEADMQVLIQQLPKIEKPGTDWQIRKDCSQASMKFESNPPKSCYVGLGSITLLKSAQDVIKFVDRYNSIFVSQKSFAYTPTAGPKYPNLSKGIDIPTSRLFTDFNIRNASGEGGTFTHQATSIRCDLEYNVQVSETKQSFLNTNFACDDTSNALHF